MKSILEQNDYDRMRNDPENYKWGIFYFNHSDKRTILPKRNQFMGWTFNFASIYTYLIIVGLIVFAIIMGNLE
jgi:uncharacterized membrane protein